MKLLREPAGLAQLAVEKAAAELAPCAPAALPQK
jgi:hypothetical protein